MAFYPCYSYDMSILPSFHSLPSFLLLYNQVVSKSPFCTYLIHTFIAFAPPYPYLISTIECVLPSVLSLYPINGKSHGFSSYSSKDIR